MQLRALVFIIKEVTQVKYLTCVAMYTYNLLYLYLRFHQLSHIFILRKA